MRAVALFAVLVVGCGKKPATEPEPTTPPATEVPAQTQDMRVYTDKLASQVPVDSELFKSFNWKATEYTLHPILNESFEMVTVEVPRVHLTDAITGKGAWYTRAKLTAGRKLAPEGYGWLRVEMLP